MFPQVSLLHLLQVFIILPSSVMLEENREQFCYCARTATLSLGVLITAQTTSQLTTEEMQHSCSWKKGTRCTYARSQILIYGQLSSTPHSVGIWSVSCDWELMKGESKDLGSKMHLLYKNLNSYKNGGCCIQTKKIIKILVYWMFYLLLHLMKVTKNNQLKL